MTTYIVTQGIQGPEGAQGATGPAGATGADSTVPGPTGAQGATCLLYTSQHRFGDSTLGSPTGTTGSSSSTTERNWWQRKFKVARRPLCLQ